MKTNKSKTVFCWILVIFALAGSILSPIIVSASTMSDAQNANRYDEAAYILYLAKIVDTCVPRADDSDELPFSGSDATVEARKKLMYFYNLNFAYDRTKLYDSYLETLGQGKYDDGKVYCREMDDQGVNPVATLLTKYDLYTSSELENIACGRNNEGGLFKIRMGYYCGGLGCDKWGPDGTNARGQWPENWPAADNDGYTTDCKAAFKKVKYFTEENTSATIPTTSTRFEVKFEINDNFSFQTYLSEYLGSYNSFASELTQANQYLNLVSACDISWESKAQYDSAVANGAANQYSIYHDGQIKYMTLNSPSRSLYWNQPGSSLTSENSSTCKQLADELSPSGTTAQRLIDIEKMGMINNCYDAATESIKNIKKIATYINSIKNSAMTLLNRAELVLASEAYGAATFSTTYFADYMEGYAKKVSGDDTIPVSMQGFIDQTRSFEEKVRLYHEGTINGAHTDEEKEDMQGEINNYTDNINTFTEKIVDKVADAINEIPELDLSSAVIYGPVLDNQSSILNKVDRFYEFDSDGNFTCIATTEILPGIANKIEGITGTDIDLTDYTPPDRTIYSDDSTDLPQTDQCYNAGVESMSWILCPAINNMASAVDGIDAMLASWLSVDADLYENGSHTEEAWGYFRSIANIMMIIFLLVIIFSQLTGFGIDNYGIKKMLPKLILMAVLINLSFLICQLAIDLSNILGVSLSTMFKNIGLSIYDGLTAGQVVTTIVAALFTTVGVAGAASGTIISIVGLATGGGGVMLVISLVLVLLAALVAILMFFIMLGARMIIIIIFTAIAPLAFACFIFPNTQGYFKKWWDIFKTMLIMYPICGALYGMSFIIRGLVFVNDGNAHFWMAIVAVCAPFLPFLLLPTLLRGALAALGKVGGTVAALGTGLRGGLRSGNQTLQNTAAYKSAQEASRRNTTRWSAGLDRNGNQRRLGRFGRFIRGGERGIAAARAQYKKDIETQGIESSMMGIGFDSGVASAEARVDAQRVAGYESLLDLGKAMNSDGSVVNTNNAHSLGTYHREALARYNSATDVAGRTEAMAQIKAAQNILSKTDKGRAEIQSNFESAIRSGQTGGLSVAASHLMGTYGDKFKSVNRGAHAMLSDLSTKDLADPIEIAGIRAKLDSIGADGRITTSGAYSMAGTDKYTEDSLAGADDIAIDRMIESIQNGSLTGNALSDIRGTAYRALQKSRSGNLNIKPEVARKLEQISHDYVPPVDPSGIDAARPSAPGAAAPDEDFTIPRDNNPPESFEGGAGI